MSADPATAAARRVGVCCSTEAIGDRLRCRAARPERAAWAVRAALPGRADSLGRAVVLGRLDEDRDGFRCCAGARDKVQP